MSKHIFFLLTLFAFTGCAERGYKLTSNLHTHTAIAQSSTSINQKEKTPQKLDKMKQAVKEELSKQTSVTKIAKPKKSVPKETPHIEKVTSLKKNSQETQFTHRFTEDELLSSSTEDLIFERLNRTYQKFGNSEIHGHVIYLSPTGVETRLKNTRIYLLATNKKLNHWYTDSYLKNSNPSGNPLKVNYLNTTYLNLSKNFAFHGIPAGEYFVIIVSDSPNKNEKNRKVYIAKKIKVEERKKIMAVFSKKLQ